ncbi:4-hydroxy-tetrahydrodipicolinate synthase [Patescibacteria group bacterium]|nr:4-hydroxy-tetrahydrodipicolinate synthase [Patescibacteria group bacterium]MBU2259957.1 4-hydroxy-tetrahydrodipicolinate synthase [Patescibacteria group bacterium]
MPPNRIADSDVPFGRTITALITPFTESGDVDYDLLRELASIQASVGNAVCILGTTGEAPTIRDGAHETEDERGRIIREVVDEVKERVAVIVGTGTNFTEDAIYSTQQAAELGADGALVVTPYYNKPSQRDFIDRYFEPIGKVGLSVIMYDIPGRTAAKMDAQTIIEASQLPGIAGLKFASGDFDQLKKVREEAPNFPVWSGDDANTIRVMEEGGVGVVSVASNVDPKRVHHMVELASKRDWHGAKAIDRELVRLVDACFPEGYSNPRGVKLLVSMISGVRNTFRPPLGPLPEEVVREHDYEGILKRLGLDSF